MIKQLFQIPFVRPEGIDPRALYTIQGCRAFVRNEIDLPRTGEFLRLLAGERRLEDFQIVENGSSANPFLALVAARRGADILIKEPSGPGANAHRLAIADVADEDLKRRIRYADHLMEPAEADLVTWVNVLDLLNLPAGMVLGAYLARDVRPGGYLVIECARFSKRLPNLPPHEWETVFEGDIDGPLVPTMYRDDLWLGIYRRRVP